MESSALCPPTLAPGDLALMARVARGDDAAVREMLGLHLAALSRFAYAAMAGADGADDAVQASLIRAVRSASRYDGRASLRTWLLAIAWREIQRVRRRKAWLPLFDRAEPSRGIAAVDGADWVRSALAALPPDLRAAFALVHVEGLSIAEAAETLSLPEGTVKSRVHAAKARLRLLLEADHA